MDFCDSQAGRGACDRKAAAIKSHMKIYLNSGNNIESAEEMRDAILSSGGLPSVNVTVSGPSEVSAFPAIRLEGVSTISNIEYANEGLRIGRNVQNTEQQNNKRRKFQGCQPLTAALAENMLSLKQLQPRRQRSLQST